MLKTIFLIQHKYKGLPFLKQFQTWRCDISNRFKNANIKQFPDYVNKEKSWYLSDIIIHCIKGESIVMLAQTKL